ncbi:hypothetical protein, partial [Marinitenerispora sediminis]
STGSAVGALIANILALCLCWVFAAPGLILAIVALSQTASNPSSARTCTLISWILFGVAVLSGAAYFAYWLLVGGALWFETLDTM